MPLFHVSQTRKPISAEHSGGSVRNGILTALGAKPNAPQNEAKPRYLVHETKRAPECFETEGVLLFFVYERGQFDTDTLCGHSLATCDSAEDAHLIAKALNQFNP